MNNHEKERKIKSGTFIFPENWIELNPEKADECSHVVFLVDKEKCGVYYSKVEAYALSEDEEKKVMTVGVEKGFLADANIFGYVEELGNVGNARIIGGCKDD